MFIALSACENPADKTTDASVSEKVEVEKVDAAADAVTYTFSDDSKLEWVGSKVTGIHNGGFKSFTGEIAIADGTLSVSGQTITIDMESIWSDNDKLTGHLKSEDFMNTSKFPQSTFELTGVKTKDKKPTRFPETSPLWRPPKTSPFRQK